MSSTIDISGISNNIDVSAVEYEEAELFVAGSLPIIPGLCTAATTTERMEIMTQSIEKSRADFIAMYGDPFGCDISSNSDGASAKVLQDIPALPRSVETA